MGKPEWTNGRVYEDFVGRWSRLVAREFIQWLDMPAGLRWLDIGCGTGALTQTILQMANPSAVTGVDVSEPIVDFTRGNVTDLRVTFAVGDAQQIPADDESFDVAVSGLVLNFVPDMSKALAEMMRVTAPHGIAACYVWDYTDRMQMMRYFWDAAHALNPGAASTDEGSRFPICRPEPLTNLFQNAGLKKIETRPIDISTPFRNFDDYWTPFLSGQAPAPRYAMSLSEADRAALREELRAKLPTEADGSIQLVARAWAIRGAR